MSGIFKRSHIKNDIDIDIKETNNDNTDMVVAVQNFLFSMSKFANTDDISGKFIQSKSLPIFLTNKCTLEPSSLL